MDRPPSYRSYVLTCWAEQSQDPSVPVVWRFSLEDPHTGQRRGFVSPEDLFAFLEQQMGMMPGADRDNRETRV